MTMNRSVITARNLLRAYGPQARALAQEREFLAILSGDAMGVARWGAVSQVLAARQPTTDRLHQVEAHGTTASMLACAALPEEPVRIRSRAA